MKALDQAIYAALAARSQLTSLLKTTTSIYPDVAPKGALPPYVIIARNDSEDRYTFGGRIGGWVPYVIRGVTGPTEDPEAGEDIAEQVDLAITDQSFTMSSGHVIYARRQGEVRYSEKMPEGDNYFHIGGHYRFGVSTA